MSRLKIGVLTGHLGNYYNCSACEGIIRNAENLNTEIIFFIGGSIKPPRISCFLEDSVYDFTQSLELDGLLVILSSLDL